MALSIERKVEVRTGVISPVVSENIQNCLLLSDQDKFINHGIKEYTSATDVSNDFGVDSRETNFAKSYFKSFVGATKRPEKLLIAENYSAEALPASITSSFFTAEDTPQEKLKNIGETGATSAMVITEPIISDNKVYMIDALKQLDGNTPGHAYIIGAEFDTTHGGATQDTTFQTLNNITGANVGDFSIVFDVNGEEKTATATNIDLGSEQDLDGALLVIQIAINSAIDDEEDLGVDYEVELHLNGDANQYNFYIGTLSTGAQYKIVRTFSTVPVNIPNIADTLKLSPASNPTTIDGTNGVTGDLEIGFNVDGEAKTATAVGLNFSTFNDLDAQLNYLETQINNAITAEAGLGADYLVNIKVQNEAEDEYFSIIIETQNKGTKYKIINVTSSPLTDFTNVADILRLSDNFYPSYYDGSDKELGDFSVMFKIDNDTRRIATATNLDFSAYNYLDEQLDYLTNEINRAIIAEEGLGNDYTVTIKKNDLQDGMYNVSISTNNLGSKYNIEYVFSRIPLEEDRVDTILKLNSAAIPAPTVIVGTDVTPLAEVLDKYANERSDWWTIAAANQNMSVYGQISEWVDNQNVFSKYVFIAHDDNALANSTTANPDTFGFSTYTSGRKGTTTVFGDETLAGFVAGVAASIDYEMENGTLTFSGRRQSGFTPTVALDKEANCLETNYYNYYGSYSSTNPKYNFFETGVVSGSDGLNWLDSLFNQIWLRKRLQDALLNLLLDKKKIPFTDAGYSIIANTCDYVANKAIYNGIISPGVALSEDQIATVNEEVGKDVSENLQTYGYYVLIGENTSSDRVQRIARNCKMFYCDGGAIQSIKMVVNVLI